MLEPAGAGLIMSVEMADGAAMVGLRGELDVSVRVALAQQLAEVVVTRPAAVVFDLAEVTFIDCGIARLLADIGQWLPSTRKPVLRSIRPQVRRLLELSELDTQCELPPGPDGLRIA